MKTISITAKQARKLIGAIHGPSACDPELASIYNRLNDWVVGMNNELRNMPEGSLMRTRRNNELRDMAMAQWKHEGKCK